MGRSRFTDIFRQHLRRLRLEAVLSQDDLAHKVGVHRNFIDALERGERNPTLVSVVKVAVALGADPADMLRESSGGCETKQDRLVVEAVRREIRRPVGLRLSR